MKRAIIWLFGVFGLGVSPFLVRGAETAGENRVDFHYSLPWWQSAICLPDDADKILVGKEGELLLDFGQGGFRGFKICLQPEIAGGAQWVRQQTISPRAPVMQTWENAAGVEVLEETFVVTPVSGRQPADAVRRIVVLVTLRNRTGTKAVCQPALRIKTVLPVAFSSRDGAVMVGQQTRIVASEAVQAWEAKPKADGRMLLPPVTLAPGASRQVVFTIDRSGKQLTAAKVLHAEREEYRQPTRPPTAAAACSLRDAACRWWDAAGLPFDTIQIPDSGIQGMIQSCVRNIWQAREIKHDKPAFHVGPTVYRGLWVVDGSFLLESAAMLNRAQDARAGIEYLLGHQKPDGSFEIIRHYWKENGIVLWAATRHAMLTQDKRWLLAHWPALKRVVKAIANLRAAALKDPRALDYGLLPAGFIDGGIANGDPSLPEYSNTHWCLAGLKAAIAAARWLGDQESAQAWQKEYDDFYAVLRKAALRDMLKDKFGNAYVPTMMGNAGKFTPQKGQWAFCHAVYPGQVFGIGDPLAEGQIAMLRATKVEGMVFDTGWIKDGIWTYFASFYGHAVLWMGHGDEAAQVLYDFANHAAPTRVWREEQKPVGKPQEEVGDMPHNWASAEFIRLAAHLLELDRGDELHLLEGMPAQWLKAGMVTRLNGVLTPFGPLWLTVRADRQGKTAALELKPLSPNCKSVVVHLPNGTLRRLPPTRPATLTFTTDHAARN
jgi:hypothetical protein